MVFQLAHCVGEAEFPQPADGRVRMADAWAVHQVQTTVDFARDSRVLCWLLGGLNFQVVHHLFPQVCHVHYPALSRIVEATCSEFGVRYSAHRSFLAGVVVALPVAAQARPPEAGPRLTTARAHVGRLSCPHFPRHPIRGSF